MGFSAGTLATLSLASQVGGGLMSTVGSYSAARSERSSLRSQAGLADINARMAELNAQSELSQGNQEIASLTLQAGNLRSRQRAALGANGVDMGAGSAAEMLASTDIMKDIDARTLEANAARSAWGYRTEAVNYENQARSLRASASSISPGMSAFSTLLGSAGQVASSWYQFNKAGVWDSQVGKGSKTLRVSKDIQRPKNMPMAKDRAGYVQSYKMLRA